MQPLTPLNDSGTILMKLRGIALAIGAGALITVGSQVSAAENVNATRAELKLQVHKAVEQEDWSAVDNLKTALQNLDARFSKPAMAKAKAKTPAETDDRTFPEKVKDAGFTLQLSPNDDNPALFAFTRDFEAGTETEFTADFFLSWQLPEATAYRLGWRQDSWDLDAGVSVQGKLTSADNTKTDAWRYRATLSGRYTLNATSNNLNDIVGLTWNASFKDEASRGFEYNRIGGELNLTPTIPALAMGVYKPDPSDTPATIRFRWRPFVGLDAGTTTSHRHTAAAGADDTLWLTAKLTAKLQLGFLARALNFQEVSLFAEDHAVYLSEADTFHNYLTTGLSLMMTDNFGLSFGYKIGQDSPTFKREEILSGAFAVRF